MRVGGQVMLIKRRGAVSALLLIVLAAIGGLIWSFSVGAPMARSGNAVLFTVKPGEGAAVVAQDLAGRHLVASAFYVKLLADVSGDSARLKAGIYFISPAMSPRAILNTIVSGRVATRKVVIPEGFTVKEIAQRMEASDVVSAASFMAAAMALKNPYLPAGAAVLDPAEGYLFPSTYEISYGTSAQAVVALLFGTFQKEVPASLLAEGAKEGLSPSDVVTLGSIVEKEGGTPQDQLEIASVFFNRIHLKMPLGSDTTLDYALGLPKDNLTQSDLKSTSPYNTFHKPGLPPGPISCPGLAAIQAVLHPATTTYLYFYSQPDGTVVFSNTYAQQLAEEQKVKSGK